ncbi:YhcN/YlaJ family sporulation lipoprotein [Evansella cellulosilytica]|uniref:Lipoprotein n=1 Tax=Evansella cellulosilytica (strain ATCC 21833 / DSM 2522 / FERM P-1141 / JCM 9156 / N-4) TaxID=649639 RepID=E6TYM7_EVAC2|nr:YhcN/YlaJ family sporulation lipoprotein [Evansella cellulosilytica]ADU30077.1 hypothetical protein Bcell_1815 [Evansella cellulosilytica DSM 2522]
MLKASKLFPILIVLLFVVACATNDETQHIRSLEAKPSVSQEKAKQTEMILKRMNEVEEVQAVSLKDDVYVAVNVTGFDRLFLEKIRKEAYKRANDLNSDGEVYVSTDRKIFMQLTNLYEEIYDGKKSEEQLKKDLAKIKEDM